VKKGKGVRRSQRLGLLVDSETSRRLGRVRQRDTDAELRVRRLLSELGLHYRTHNRDLPGSPDIANRKHKWAVFVHGCFWHRHKGCPRTTTPKRNAAFWKAKFEANALRDRRSIRLLRSLGFRVAVVWECEAEEPPPSVRRRLLSLGTWA
jgi:DNA mismatch endonuclease, patch repair protein